jgi:hypothetical protein
VTTLTALSDLRPLPLYQDRLPRPEQRGWIFDNGLVPVVIQYVLDRTAVIRRLPDIGEKELINQQLLYVEAETLVWYDEGGLTGRRDRLNKPIRRSADRESSRRGQAAARRALAKKHADA